MTPLEPSVRGLDWPILKETLADCARTSRGAAAIRAMGPLSGIPEIEVELDATCELIALESEGNEVAVGAVGDIGAAVERASKGHVLDGEALLVPDDRSARLATGPGSDTALLIDFGRIHAGHPFVELTAAGGEVVELAVAEGIPGDFEADTGPDRPRIDRTRAHGAYLFRYVWRCV